MLLVEPVLVFEGFDREAAVAIPVFFVIQYPLASLTLDQMIVERKIDLFVFELFSCFTEYSFRAFGPPLNRM